ncbi:hypothetical protein EDC04DRAFT_2610308 [Pisolithus marmoratus]|nr:hypothetical protein EDC04DRAFT_2610308 [Pisolithus marmoratus]
MKWDCPSQNRWDMPQNQGSPSTQLGPPMARLGNSHSSGGHPKHWMGCPMTGQGLSQWIYGTSHSIEGLLYSIGISQARGELPEYHSEVPQHWGTSHTPDGMSLILGHPQNDIGKSHSIQGLPHALMAKHQQIAKESQHMQRQFNNCHFDLLQEMEYWQVAEVGELSDKESTGIETSNRETDKDVEGEEIPE